MSRNRDLNKPVPQDGLKDPGRDIAAEIVAAIGADRLVDIKFLIESSSAPREEILEAALKWVRQAESNIKKHSHL